MMAQRAANSGETRRLLEGSSKLRSAVAAGSIPIPIEELLEAQAALFFEGADEVEVASRSLLATAPHAIVEALETGPSPRLAEFCLRRFPDAKIQLAGLRHRSLEAWILAEVAPSMGPDLQRALVQRQDAIESAPEILRGLRANSNLSPEVGRRVAELEKLVVSPEDAPDTEEELVEANDAELEEALEVVRAAPVQGEIDDQTNLSEGQIRLLPPSVKLRLARNAGVRLRNLMVRDSNPVVATTALMTSSFSATEIERIARSRTVEEEVLELIAKDRRWCRKYPVQRSLVSNPKTPVGVSLRLLSGIAPRDLKVLRTDRNIPDAVRSRARQFYRVKVG